MKAKLCALFFLMTAFALPQIIEKIDYINLARCYDVNSKDSVTYIFTNDRIFLLKFNYNNSHDIIKDIYFTTSEDVHSCVKDSVLLVKNSDSLFYFDISNPKEPYIINKWGSLQDLEKIFEFGPFFVFKFENNYKIVTVGSDSIRYIFNISFSECVISYPYIIQIYNYDWLKLFRYMENNELQWLKDIYEHDLDDVSAGKNRLVYTTETYSGPPSRFLKVVDLSDTTFPYITNLFWASNIYFSSLDQNSEIYFSAFYHLEGTKIHTMSGGDLYSYPQTLKVHFAEGRVYAFSDSILYCSNELVPGFFYRYKGIPFLGNVLQYNPKLINLMSISPQNTLIKTDSINYAGDLTSTDSGFFFEDNCWCEFYSIINNKFVKEFDPMKFPTCDYIVDAGKFALVEHDYNNDVDVFIKKSPNPEKIFTFSEFPRYNKKSAVSNDSLLFVCDYWRGVLCYYIKENQQTRKWLWDGGDHYSFTKKGNHLIIKVDHKIYLMDINSSINNPFFVDSLDLPQALEYGDVIATPNSVFVKTKSGSRQGIMKLVISDNTIVERYSMIFDFNIDFNLTEGYQKLVILNQEQILWIKDSTLTSLTSDANENTLLFSLSQNYPNPFNPTTTLNYTIQKPGPVTIKIYDVLGNEIAVLLNEEKPAGEYEINFNASTYNIASGVYFYQIRTTSFVETKKMILSK